MGKVIPMGLIDRLVERAFPGVYWNPARWPTADGYVPAQVFDLYAAALFPAAALDRLNMGQAIGLAMGADPAARESAVAAALREVYPEGA